MRRVPGSSAASSVVAIDLNRKGRAAHPEDCGRRPEFHRSGGAARNVAGDDRQGSLPHVGQHRAAKVVGIELEFVQEPPGCYDRDALERVQDQQVGVSGDETGRRASNGQIEEFVILGIATEGRNQTWIPPNTFDGSEFPAYAGIFQKSALFRALRDHALGNRQGAVLHRARQARTTPYPAASTVVPVYSQINVSVIRRFEHSDSCFQIRLAHRLSHMLSLPMSTEHIRKKVMTCA